MENVILLALKNRDTLASVMTAIYVAKKKSYPNFSIRAWTRVLGLKHSSTLCRIMSGKQSCPERVIDRLFKIEGLSEDLKSYLLVLSVIEQSLGQEQRRVLESLIRPLREKIFKGLIK